MATLRLLSVLVFATLVALPAAAASPGQGAFDAQGLLEVTGAAQVEADALHLAWNGSAGPSLQLEGSGIHVLRMGHSVTRSDTPVGPVVFTNNPDVSDKKDYASGTLTLSGEGGRVLLQALGASSFAGEAGSFRPVEYALLLNLQAQVNDCHDLLKDLCAAATSVYELGHAPASANLSGPVRLALRGPTLHVKDAQGQESTFTSGVSTGGAGGLTTEDTWVLVTIDQSAHGVVSGAAPQRAFVGPSIVRVASLALDRASGRLGVGASDYNAADDAVQASGALVLALAPVPAPTGGITQARADPAPVYAGGFHVDISGDVATINLRATPVFVDHPAQTVGGLALALAAVGALAYYWPLVSFHLAALVAPLYTRLRQPEILDNDVRNRIYEIIRTNPGISARAVHRESAQSWGTVVYHLRQLERHHLVVSRTLGRTRNYYENHGKYKGMEVQLACLQSDRALSLARIILAQPGVTQELLAAGSGFPQPTTSYYVRKLRKAGLVDEVREGRYVRYQPAEDLARFVALADAPADAAVTGVEA